MKTMNVVVYWHDEIVDRVFSVDANDGIPEKILTSEKFGHAVRDAEEHFGVTLDSGGDENTFELCMADVDAYERTRGDILNLALAIMDAITDPFSDKDLDESDDSPPRFLFGEECQWIRDPNDDGKFISNIRVGEINPRNLELSWSPDEPEDVEWVEVLKGYGSSGNDTIENFELNYSQSSGLL